jgi:hypothetical protein
LSCQAMLKTTALLFVLIHVGTNDALESDDIWGFKGYLRAMLECLPNQSSTYN